MQRLLRREGPNNQYGSGCLSDGVIGVWMAKIYGVPLPLDQRKIRSSLHAIYRYNYCVDLSAHANTQRPGYALGNEAGQLLCSWPRSGQPTLPFIYSDEVWTGIKYQVASHLAAEGMPEKTLQIVRAARSRYDGDVRNPFNEYECGSYYARAMASYALLGSFSGFRYFAVEKKLWLAPATDQRPFAGFFCCASWYGRLALDARSPSIRMIAGALALSQIELMTNGRSRSITLETIVRPGRSKCVQWVDDGVGAPAPPPHACVAKRR